jgi:hypothetical protein
VPSNNWHDMNDVRNQLLKLMAHVIHALLTVAWLSDCKKDSRIWLYHTPRCCGSVVLGAPILGWWSVTGLSACRIS